MIIRKYKSEDLEQMITIWNEVVEEGIAFLQFSAVVESNIHARHLYERIGFTQLGVIPNGFRMKDGHFENICPYYIEL